MLKYNICFIRQADTVLLLNREHPSWMGAWNGVGGKLEPGETARESVLREVREETGITLPSVDFRGVVTWAVDGKAFGGMYVYSAELPAGYRYDTPLKTDEGILDWKTVAWITHPENQGVAGNLPKSIRRIIEDPGCFDHRCFYENGRLVREEFVAIGSEWEYDADIETRIFANRTEVRHSVPEIHPA